MTKRVARIEGSPLHVPWFVLCAGLYLRVKGQKRAGYLGQGDAREAFLCEGCGALLIEGKAPASQVGPVDY